MESVVDVGPQRVQRNATFAVELRPAHLGAAETTRALDPDALGSAAHRALLRLAHGPAELHPGGELLGHALGDQLGVDLGVLHLEDVQLHLLAGQLLQLAADALGLGTVAADDDARAGGVDVDPDPVTGALDLDRGDAGPLQALGQQPADLDVLADVGAVELLGEPTALVVGADSEAEAVRVDLLAHGHDSPRFLRGSTTTVMWLDRFRIRLALPLARGRIRRMVTPSSTNAWDTNRSARRRLSRLLGVGRRARDHLVQRLAGRLRGELQRAQRIARRPCPGPGRAPGGPWSARSGPAARSRTNPDGRRAAPGGGWDAVLVLAHLFQLPYL